jgi:uncharacterized cupredoxin-like copper-binding protein
VSRGPVVVLIIGAAAIVSLVLLGAALAGVPVARPQGTTPGTAENPRDVNVIMRDYHFDPTPLFLYAGETVRLHVFNAGMLEHELVLGNAAVQQAWDAADSRATPPAPFATAPAASVEPALGGLRLVLGSGQSADTLYAVPAAEAPQLLCHLPGHVEHGMVGEVVLVNH